MARACELSFGSLRVCFFFFFFFFSVSQYNFINDIVLECPEKFKK